MIKVAINGFGRIGRRVFRLALQNPKIQIVAINDLADSRTLSHLLKYDSIHGILNESVSFDENHIILNDIKIRLYRETSPKSIDWSSVNPDVVIESGVWKGQSTKLIRKTSGFYWLNRAILFNHTLKTSTHFLKS